jgi:hypothetical protein
VTFKIKDLSEYFTEEDIARNKRKTELEVTSRRLDNEIAALKASQDNGENNAHEKYIESLISGNDAAPPKSSAVQLHERRQQKLNVETALDVLAGKDYLALVEAKKRMCLDLNPQSDSLGKQLAEAASALNRIHLEYFKIKRHLINEGIGLHGGVFSADVEQFVGIPWDRTSAFADYFRNAVKAGHIKHVPEALR